MSPPECPENHSGLAIYRGSLPRHIIERVFVFFPENIHPEIQVGRFTSLFGIFFFFFGGGGGWFTWGGFKKRFLCLGVYSFLYRDFFGSHFGSHFGSGGTPPLTGAEDFSQCFEFFFP